MHLAISDAWQRRVLMALVFSYPFFTDPYPQKGDYYDTPDNTFMLTPFRHHNTPRTNRGYPNTSQSIWWP